LLPNTAVESLVFEIFGLVVGRIVALSESIFAEDHPSFFEFVPLVTDFATAERAGGPQFQS